MFVCVFLICLYHCVYKALSENWECPCSSQTSSKSQSPTSVTATLVFPAFSSHFLSCSCSKGMEQVQRIFSPSGASRGAGNHLSCWDGYLEEFVALSFPSVPEGGYGAVGKGFCSRNSSLAIRERLFQALRALALQGSQECVLSTCGNSSAGPAAALGAGWGEQLRICGAECPSCPALQGSCTQPWEELLLPASLTSWHWGHQQSS